MSCVNKIIKVSNKLLTPNCNVLRVIKYSNKEHVYSAFTGCRFKKNNEIWETIFEDVIKS